jgi:hypothetical protein
MNCKVHVRRGVLSAAIVAALGVPSVVVANTIVVNGTTCTLANAITSANNDFATGGCSAGSGNDTIELSADITLTAELPPVNSNIAFSSSGFSTHSIVGDGFHRLFFVGCNGLSPTASFASLILSNGKATGGAGNNGAGGGAGLGGAIFICDGNVSIGGVIFSGNSATGGSSLGSTGYTSDSNIGKGGDGGGGMFGSGGAGGTDPSYGGAKGRLGGRRGGGRNHRRCFHRQRSRRR